MKKKVVQYNSSLTCNGVVVGVLVEENKCKTTKKTLWLNVNCKSRRITVYRVFYSHCISIFIHSSRHSPLNMTHSRCAFKAITPLYFYWRDVRQWREATIVLQDHFCCYKIVVSFSKRGVKFISMESKSNNQRNTTLVGSE